MKIAPQDTRGPLDPPEWFVTRCEELSRLMSSTPESVAKGLWYDLIQRRLVEPDIIPGRVLGPIGWHKQPPTTLTSGTNTGAVQIMNDSGA